MRTFLLSGLIRLFLILPLFAGSVAQAGDIKIIDPWVRGTVSGQTLSAAFMRLESPRAAMLVAASSPRAREVRLIDMSYEGRGPLVAHPVSSIPLARGMTYLSPVTAHLQLVDIKQPLVAGERIELSLKLEYGNGQTETLQVQAVVRTLGGPGTSRP